MWKLIGRLLPLTLFGIHFVQLVKPINYFYTPMLFDSIDIMALNRYQKKTLTIWV